MWIVLANHAVTVPQVHPILHRTKPMKVQLERINDAIQFRGSNGRYELNIASKKEQEGISPMEMVALATGGCSSIDVLMILEKQRQEVGDFNVEVDAKRKEGGTSSEFTDVHLTFRVTGDVESEKVQRAIDLSLEKYCSVSKMIEKTADISYTLFVNGEEVASVHLS